MKWPSYDSIWAFDLEPVGPENTQLTVRVRAAHPSGVRNGLVRLAVGIAHEVMEFEQLRNLKKRVKRARADALRRSR